MNPPDPDAAVDSAFTREALARPPAEVAPDLLGARLTRVSREGTVTVEITEVEAYDGTSDPASHAYRGRTARNAVMFGEPGHLYVYFSYGMHWCANVVTGVDGYASGVLLRAGRVIEGEELARARRGTHIPPRGLARGPACLTQALGINKDHWGLDVLGSSPITLTQGRRIDEAHIAAGPRVGVRLAADVPWRFWIRDDETVSAYKRNPRAAAAG